MENNKDGSDKNRKSKIDLTLKLGPSTDDKQNQEEEKDVGNHVLHDFFGVDGQGSGFQGNFGMQAGQGSGNVEFGGSSAAYRAIEGGSTNVMLYQGFPSQNLPSPSRKRPNANNMKICHACGADNTPLWRKGPGGPQTLCNACGLKHLRSIKKNNAE